jgi:outer membrane protein OmpA-like peptidoglycan-associated protein
MIRKIVLIVTLLFVFSFQQQAEAKVARLKATPLSERINTSVQDCSNTVKQVKIITWGGDMAPIYGNGGKTTQKNSLFDQKGIGLSLSREDVFAKQVEEYLKCESPYLRGTMDMMALASDIASKDPRTEIQVVSQLTWSTGGDAVVVKQGIKSLSDFKGKTIALQLDGPHIYYLATLLKSVNLKMSDVNIVWTKDLTGKTGQTPMDAFKESDIDVAIVIVPDALALTSNGTVGTGGEDSVKGAKMLLTTKTASRVIADVYGVRKDYYESHRDEVQNFVHGLMLAEESLIDLVKNKKTRGVDYKKMLSMSAELLLDSPQATADAEGMYGDCTFVGWKGNVSFFTDPKFPRNFENLSQEIKTSFVTLGLISGKTTLTKAKWDYNHFKAGLKNTTGVEAPKFDQSKVAQIVNQNQKMGNSTNGELYAFEIYFKANQTNFSAVLYEEDFKRVIDWASKFAGAVIIIEGHSDPLGYLKKKKAGDSPIVLNDIKQSAKNLSIGRANSVRDGLIDYAKAKGIRLDSSQFTAVGWGITNPKTGMCGDIPCAPKTEQEWLSNMRVRFQIIQVEAESTEFSPL